MVVAAEWAWMSVKRKQKKILTETQMDASLRMRCVQTQIVLDVAGGRRG